MKMSTIKSVADKLAAAAMGVAVLTVLNSCDKIAQEPAAPAEEGAAPAEAPAEAAATAEVAAPAQPATEALLETLIYDLGARASENAAHPELTEAVRNMLAHLEEYYTQQAESLAGKPEKVRLALRLADTAKDLTAWERACGSYDRALADFDALPEADREQTDNKRLLSSICNGKAFCLLRRGMVNEALEMYTKALEIDSALYALVAPAEGAALPEGDVEPGLARAAEEVFFSYRCLGECQEVAEDPEEARETFKAGIALAVRLDRLSPGMSLQYIRLLGALGNLESRCGNEREALAQWLQAATMCERLHNSTTNLIIRSKTARAFQSLVPNIQALQKKFGEEQPAAEAPAVQPDIRPGEQPAELPATPQP